MSPRAHTHMSDTFIARTLCTEPPKIIDEETSASFVEHNEFEQLVLRCSVVSEPQAQLMWKREDGALSVLDAPALEQRFKHQFERTPSGRVRSRDSSELRFEPFVREHAGAYLVSLATYYGKLSTHTHTFTDCLAHSASPRTACNLE